VLTGAGMSTASGIPDYRGPTARPRKRPPIDHRDFVGHASTRARYWARSVLGWPRFRSFEPNPAHHALAKLQATGRVHHLITQNVDGLHQLAGSVDVLELHGALAQVRCLSCGALTHRDDLQQRLLEANPRAVEWTAALEPDGDADLPDEVTVDFVVPGCRDCGGVLKPDVVFFGDNVPVPRLQRALEFADDAQTLLVMGSSLTVYSGFRFVLRAKERGQRVVLVNRGPTRADELCDFKLDEDVGAALAGLG
jgi:NAD-dependent SIR2 family protein deacetylase